MTTAISKKRKVALWSVVAALFITGFKLTVGLLTGSLGILSEALHSGLDLLAALLTLFAVSVSDRPADREHNYGHGKIENLSAFVETLLLLATCIWIVYEAISRLVSGRMEIEVTVWSYAVMIGSIVVDVSRSRALGKVARESNSQALEADALHFSTDIWSASVVVLGLICAQLGIYMADAIAALLVAVFVTIVSVRLGIRSVNQLLDKASPEVRDKVRRYLVSKAEVRGFHGLKVRSAGADTFVEVSVRLSPELTLRQAHGLCDRIEGELQTLIPRSEVAIHAEPARPSDSRSCSL